MGSGEAKIGETLIVKIQTDDHLARFCTPPGLPPLDPAIVRLHRPDAGWMLVDHSGDVTARCSSWHRTTPLYLDRPVGFIGHYAARTPAAAARLLSRVCDHLAAKHCALAVGPIDGSTWRNYRFVIESGPEPPFFLEPHQPAAWPAHFTGHGFTVFETYVSTLKPDLNRPTVTLARVARRASARGFTLRPIELENFAAALARIYPIALAAFQDNVLYSPIDRAEFIAMYQPLKPLIQPELTLMAELEGQPVGFIFALPDVHQAKRGEAIDTVILKTVAVRPGYRIHGLGNLLVARCQEIAAQLGYRRAIHALMHERNDSAKISRRHETQVMRRYALFGKRL